MRTLAKTLEYIVLTAMMGGVAYYGATKLSDALNESFAISTQRIQDATEMME